MRVKISLNVVKNPSISFNYNYHLASMIYKKIATADENLAFELHVSKNPKLFTFSMLEIKKRKITKNGIKILSENVDFLFSSPNVEIVKAFIEGLIQEPEVKIEKMLCVVDKIEILKKPDFTGKFRTLSPIYVSTVNDEGKRWDLLPSEEKFYENLRKNLIKKYELFYGEEPREKDLIVKPFYIRTKRLKILNTYRIASFMRFEAEGSRELIELGYEAGFGEKNSMGFGMVEVIP